MTTNGDRQDKERSVSNLELLFALLVVIILSAILYFLPELGL